MSTIEPTQKINLGFHGGQVLSTRVSDSVLAELRSALGTKSGFYELKADSTIIFDLARVDYLLIDDDSHRVGF